MDPFPPPCASADETQAVVPAWVVVTVPRYAPGIYGIVTWYDQAVNMARTAAMEVRYTQNNLVYTRHLSYPHTGR